MKIKKSITFGLSLAFLLAGCASRLPNSTTGQQASQQANSPVNAQSNPEGKSSVISLNKGLVFNTKSLRFKTSSERQTASLADGDLPPVLFQSLTTDDSGKYVISVTLQVGDKQMVFDAPSGDQKITVESALQNLNSDAMNDGLEEFLKESSTDYSTQGAALATAVSPGAVVAYNLVTNSGMWWWCNWGYWTVLGITGGIVGWAWIADDNDVNAQKFAGMIGTLASILNMVGAGQQVKDSWNNSASVKEHPNWKIN